MASTISQLSCFSAVHRTFQIHKHSHFHLCPSNRSFSKLSVVMSLERDGTDNTGSDANSALSYAADVSKLQVEENPNSHLTKEDHDAEKLGEVEQEVNSQQKGTAKIHDFCLGIPFGGFVLTGGIIGFLFSRNPATLSSGVLFGGALLFLSTLSLKVWRQGKSSLPFILGQAALSGILIWKNFQSYSLGNLRATVRLLLSDLEVTDSNLSNNVSAYGTKPAYIYPLRTPLSGSLIYCTILYLFAFLHAGK